MIARVHRIIAKQPVESAMHLVGAGFGDNVNRCAARAAQFRRVIAPIT